MEPARADEVVGGTGASRILNLSDAQRRNLVQAGELPVWAWVSNRPLFRRSDVEALKAKREARRIKP
jgi:hypothetical protein